MEFLAERQDLRNVDVAKEWRLILTKKEIKTKVKKLAAVINEKYAGKNLVIVCILKGASYFFVDLTRQLTIPHSAYFIEASSYQNAQVQGEEVEICSRIVPSKFHNKEVLLLDELFDNGATIDMICRKIMEVGKVPEEKILTCTLFVKDKASHYPPPGLYGLLVPDVWLVGYGLDDCQEKRNWTYLYACPKAEFVPKTKDDRIFEDDAFYQETRAKLMN